jgi:hypothetical protein
MRTDLRRLLWQLRAGVIRRATLEAAVEEACSGLVAERFADGGTLRESQPCVRSLLSRFEHSIARARKGIPEGDHQEALHELQRAERSLAAASRLSEAIVAWEGLRAAWSRWTGQLRLPVASSPATLREGDRLLRVAQRFLDAGEDRKAHFVLRRGHVLLERLGARDRSRARQQGLRLRLDALRDDPSPRAAELAEAIDGLIREGQLHLADRLLDDWEMAPNASETLGRGVRETLLRIQANSREAESLVKGLELSARSEGPANRTEQGSPERDEKGV